MEQKLKSTCEENGQIIKKQKVHYSENNSSSALVTNRASFRVSPNTTPLFSISPSPTEMDALSTDIETQVYSNSSSFEYSDSFSSENMKLTEDIVDTKDNCIVFTNGSITLSLTEAKLWYGFLKVGTEMIINRTGRRMFPFIEFSLKDVDPRGLYDIIFDIIPASNKCFKFFNNKWMPIGEKEHEFENHPFKHPDSPRIGSEWMTTKISFEKVKLSNKPGTTSGTFTLHTLQKYLVQISLVKHEKNDEVSVIEFPMPATTFIAVSAYNNKDVTNLKIRSNPYSKAFRYPVKRMKIQSSRHSDSKDHKTKVAKKPAFGQCQGIFHNQCPLHLLASSESTRTNKVFSSEKNVIEKGVQTDISMADIQTWYRFLASPLGMSFFDLGIPLPIFPHVNSSIYEQEFCSGRNIHKDAFMQSRPETMFTTSNSSSSENQTEVDVQNKASGRERTLRRERLEEYNTRIERLSVDDYDFVKTFSPIVYTTEDYATTMQDIHYMMIKLWKIADGQSTYGEP